MAVNGDTSECPSAKKWRGVFGAAVWGEGASGLAQAAKLGVIYVLNIVLRSK